ncbi:unnamed protein product [Paramecium sonneborni]|uniref:Tetratricopeptide repeat protein n=1 Tax=Paramecium sonneborni TaxID=65129 RepID=A0A8S1RN21_9CILI|nr:unnamed protein product [Paramecium sonneborni]
MIRIVWKQSKCLIKGQFLNSKNQSALYCKENSLRILDQYQEAIIWAVLALEIDPRHVETLYCKSHSLIRLGQYKEAIIWADKAFQIDPQYRVSLYCKDNNPCSLQHPPKQLFHLHLLNNCHVYHYLKIIILLILLNLSQIKYMNETQYQKLILLILSIINLTVSLIKN